MRTELLAPAGDFTSLRAAVEAGCDSIYFGIRNFNMRASAKNFDIHEFGKVVDFCHKHNVRAYLCLNTIIYEDETARVQKIVDEAKKAGVDAVICWDLAVVKLASKLGLEVHLSTQASVANSGAAKVYEKLGVKRVVLARECSIEQIRRIKANTNLAIECFIHGARCISVSGRCFISQELFRKSANRGECLQPCRRSYRLTDSEEGHELEVAHNFILSPKDLCTLPFLDKLVGAGVDCFKIEGRTKSPEYVRAVVSVYRRALDAIAENKFSKSLIGVLLAELRTVYNRNFSSGFYIGMPTNDYAAVHGSSAVLKKRFIGLVRNYYNRLGVAEIKLQAGDLKLKDRIMVQGPTTGVKEQIACSMELNHKKIEAASRGQTVAVQLGFRVRKNDKVFILAESCK